jgi:hypothetical protein
MCLGRSSARVALHVGIKAGIHNFRVISYRLFLRLSLLNLWEFPAAYALLQRGRAASVKRLALGAGERPRTLKRRSVLPVRRLQRREQLLLHLHNLAKSDLGRLGRVGTLQALKVAL